MSSFSIILIIIADLLLVRILWSLIADRPVEEPKYIIVERKDGYEVCRYESSLTVEVGGLRRYV